MQTPFISFHFYGYLASPQFSTREIKLKAFERIRRSNFRVQQGTRSFLLETVISFRPFFLWRMENYQGRGIREIKCSRSQGK